MMRALGLLTYFLAAVVVLVMATRCDHEEKRSVHDKAVYGCALIGTIEGYKMGREGVPAQEQWKCGDIVKTVNAVN